MNHKALLTIQKYQMLTPGDRVMVGLSGGADSCALLHFLQSIRQAYHLDILACHVHHGLRGEEADQDEAFVRNLCDRLQIRLLVHHADVASAARQRRISTELCGRQIRYEYFECKAKELDAKIATAHTASDNLETVLLALTRGTGLLGLCGIPPVRGNIIRPLIEVTREEVEAYCQQQKIPFVTDSTNLSRDYTRNRIRLDAVPTLKAVNPAVEANISAFSDRMREIQAFLQSSARTLLEEARTDQGYRAEILQKSPPALRHEALRLLCGELAIIPEAKHLALLDNIVYNGGALELRRRVYARMKNHIFFLEQREDPPEPLVPEPLPLSVGTTAMIRHKKLSTELVNIEEYNNRKKIEKFLFHNALDYDTIGVVPYIRTRRQGDRFCPAGRNCTKTLKKLMNELHLPQKERNERLLLADGSTVLWIEGVGVAHQCRVGETTQRVLLVRCEPNKTEEKREDEGNESEY